MQRQKRSCLVLGVPLLFVLFTGCGDPEDVDISCGNLEPCVDIPCDSCGWPTVSCFLPDGDLASVTVSASGRPPFFILVDIEILSDTQAQSEKACEGGEIVIENEDGEFLRQDLTLDEPASICRTSSISGAYSVSLLCEDGFPTRARYQVTIADSNGTRM